MNRFAKGNEDFQYTLSGRLKPQKSSSSKMASYVLVKCEDTTVAVAVLTFCLGVCFCCRC